jgi:UDP-glucoronosyl and UDP-glucosyl transferase
LIPKPKDWDHHITISGFFFLSLASNYQPDPDLANFLASGPPPIYIGFGSIVVEDPNAMTKLIFEAIKETGQRAFVSKGWGGLGGNELDKPDGVFMLGNCPHDWLFQHVSCVVHHGGAGTTAAGIALGRPTVIVPFFGDQPFWGAMVARAGAGPSPIPFKELTSERLANAILEALKPETLERAKELGERIREEKGCEAGAASFHAQMDVDKLRCMMAPSRPAVWRVKTHGSRTDDIRLSTFAATVLGNEGFLDINQLRLYRPCEYPVAEHFVVSNMSGPNPILSSVGSFASALIQLPINLGKAYAGVVYEPYKGAKADGWRGFGKGLGRGVGHLLFRRRGLVIGGRQYGLRALYDAIRKHINGNTLSFILASHFAQGFEEAKMAKEEECLDVVRRWHQLAPDLKLKRSGASSASSSTLTSLTSSTSATSASTTISETSSTSLGE